MPLKLNITDGPSFRSLISLGSLFSESTWTIGFTFNDPLNGPKDTKIKSISVITLGRDTSGTTETMETCNKYSFVGYTQGGFAGEKNEHAYEAFYFVGLYDVSKRTGSCMMLTQEEFFTRPLGQYMFPDRANILRKISRAETDGSYKILRVANICEIPTNKMLFEKFIDENQMTVPITALHNADFIIADRLSVEIFVNKRDNAPIILYSDKVPKKLASCVLPLRPNSPDSFFTLADKVKVFAKK